MTYYYTLGIDPTTSLSISQTPPKPRNPKNPNLNATVEPLRYLSQSCTPRPITYRFGFPSLGSTLDMHIHPRDTSTALAMSKPPQKPLHFRELLSYLNEISTPGPITCRFGFTRSRRPLDLPSLTLVAPKRILVFLVFLGF